MSTIRGCFGVVRAGPTPVAVAEVRSWEYTETADRLDASVMGGCTKKFVAGAVETTGRLTMWWNQIAAATTPAGDAGQDLLAVGDEIALELHPNGTGTGRPELSGTATILETGGSGDVNGVAELTASFSLVGAWTRAAQP